jgi:hypothetical protein
LLASPAYFCLLLHHFQTLTARRPDHFGDENRKNAAAKNVYFIKLIITIRKLRFLAGFVDASNPFIVRLVSFSFTTFPPKNNFFFLRFKFFSRF